MLWRPRDVGVIDCLGIVVWTSLVSDATRVLGTVPVKEPVSPLYPIDLATMGVRTHGRTRVWAVCSDSHLLTGLTPRVLNTVLCSTLDRVEHAEMSALRYIVERIFTTLSGGSHASKPIGQPCPISSQFVSPGADHRIVDRSLDMRRSTRRVT